MEESMRMKRIWIGIKAAYSIIYLLLTALPSLYGPKLGDPRNVVDPSSLFHFINFIFVRFGFFLSLAALICLATANERLRARPPFSIRRDGTILVGLVIYWLACRLLFVTLNDITGSCRSYPRQTDKANYDHRECLANGGYWDGFDISGHCFLMALTASFFFDEILRSAKWFWSRWQSGHNSPVLLELGNIKQKNRNDENEDGEEEEEPESNSAAPQRTFSSNLVLWRWCQWIGIGTVCILWIAWTALLVHTCLFFHTFWEKIWGIVIGFLYWWSLIALCIY